MQKIRLFIHIVLEMQSILKFCNLIGQEHFGPYLRNQIFHQTWDLCKSTANKINFNYRPNSEKINV